MKLSAKAQASLDAVIEQFQRGDLSPIVKLATIRRDPRDDAPARHWSFSNQVMAFIQTGSLDCRGFRQWKEVGRHVRKGETAAYILVPRMVKELDEATGEESSRLIGFIGGAVFADHQTEGEPLPEFDYAPAELPALTHVARALGIDVAYRPLPPDRAGQYAPNADKIALGSHESAVFYHELAHAIHYRIDPDAKKRDKAYKETVADFTAAVLAAIYEGRDRSGNCWDYLSHYADDPLTAITKALAHVEQVLAYIETVDLARAA